jgi:hypothetical protein
MNFSQLKQAMGIFPNRQAAEQALRQLKNTGFSLEKVSVVGMLAVSLDETINFDSNQSVLRIQIDGEVFLN